MTIRRRLSLSFLLILLLFGLNLIIYFWGNQRREATVEALRQAVSRQALISGLNQNLNDIQKQVTLLSELGADLAADHARPGDMAQFHGQLERIEHQIAELKDLSGRENHAGIAHDRLHDYGRNFLPDITNKAAKCFYIVPG